MKLLEMARPAVTRGAIGLVLAVALGACSSSSDNSTGPTDFLGAYTLITVNGASLPVVISQTAVEKDEVLSGNGSINADGTFSFTITGRVTIGLTSITQSQSSTGTWTRTNNSFVFHDTAAGTTANGSFANRLMTVSAEGLNLVFRQT